MKYRCPRCGNETDFEYNYETGEVICKRCGFVVGTIMEVGPEWRVFEPEDLLERRRTGPIEKLTRVGGPETVMDRSYKDVHGKRLSSLQRAEAARTRKVEIKSALFHEHKHLRYAIGLIQKYIYDLHLPENVAETCAVWYKKLRDEGVMRGRSIEVVAAALIYAVTRQLDIPISLDEIARVTEIPKKEIAKIYRFIVKKLGLKIKIIDPMDYAAKLVKELELGDQVLRLAAKIIEEAKKLDLVAGRSPAGIAAAAVYIAARELGIRKTQKEIAEKANITEVTIRNRYRELQEKINIQKLKEEVLKETASSQ
ncbi:MAG: transcription initiation factor IIB [bacterium]|nr:transcription initiation factor IIB [bacterium]